MYNIYENFNKFLYILTLFSDLSLGEINNNIKQRTELSDNQKSMLHHGNMITPLSTICKLYRGEQAVILVKKITGH